MEGPSLIILREEAQKFVGKRVLASSGSVTAFNPAALKGQKLTKLSSWGKHFLMRFDPVVLRVHFLMFGSYRLDEPKPEKVPRLSVVFQNGAIHLYSCSIQILAEPIETTYDWRVDVMSESWDEKHVLRLISKRLDTMVCDLLLDQAVFAGSGNIIKNEVLFNLGLRPTSKVRALPVAARRALIRETRAYSHRFYDWKKIFALKKNWKVYRKRMCAACGGSVTMQKTGKLNRVSFFCPTCQKIRRRSAS